jgi:hypothetical protein
MNGLIYFRANHELIGRVLAEKLRRRTDRDRLDDALASSRIVPGRMRGHHARRSRAVRLLG